ncbi:hypothetical protein [Bradyrhizobium sp. 76]|uniref:hypothetical protein n=1 Tax=Bradyrhizobium sp. 76 TaxID=2782680 RepID=UPI001FF9513F|nr:hypothetical protein [Bradyrhizobium sp. 76]MCK1407625.1 hypothetical protein [Bradyrhizobium sp. 76]
MPDDLFLRRTVIGGETAPNDYLVIWDDLSIGRIHSSPGLGGHDVWNWSCALASVPQRSHHRGCADTLNQAKTQFQKAWDDLKAQISYDQIQKARAIENDNSRPWHKR